MTCDVPHWFTLENCHSYWLEEIEEERDYIEKQISMLMIMLCAEETPAGKRINHRTRILEHAHFCFDLISDFGGYISDLPQDETLREDLE